MADYLGSDVPSDGVIRDLAVVDGGYDSAGFAFALVAHDAALIEVGVYVDGELVGRQNSGETVGSVAGLAPGDHTLDVIPLVIGDRQYSRHGNAQGNRVYLMWPASASPDCAAYRVYADGDLIGTVTERIVYPLDRFRTSGGGRVSVFGSPAAAETINQAFTVACAGGVATFDGLAYPIQRGVTSSLPYGVRITWHDDPLEYGDFEVFVGVRSDYLTEPLSPGNFVFSIAATDAAGNESAALERTVRVMAIPPAVSITMGEFGFQPTGDFAISHVNIYSNYNVALDRLEAHIETRFPTVVLMPSFNADVRYFQICSILPIGARFNARPVIGATEREDLVIHTVVDPLAPVLVFGILGDVTITPVAGGKFRIEWNYRPEEGDSATTFAVSAGVDPNNWILGQTVQVSEGVGFPVRKFSIVTVASLATGTVGYARVTAASGFVAGPASEIVSAVADATAPAMTGTLGGAAT